MVVRLKSEEVNAVNGKVLYALTGIEYDSKCLTLKVCNLSDSNPVGVGYALVDVGVDILDGVPAANWVVYNENLDPTSNQKGVNNIQFDIVIADGQHLIVRSTALANFNLFG